MNKKLISLFVVMGLFGLAGLVAAVTIPNPLGGVSSFSVLFVNIAKAVGEIIVALGGLMILISGFLFMTSAGNPQKIEKAKTALLYAVIGMVVGGSAAAIANMVVAWMK